MLERSFQKENAFAFIVLMLAPALRSSSFIHRSHSQPPCVHRRSCLHQPCTSPALIVPHRYSRSQAPCAHPRSHARECLAFTSSLIVAQARHSSTLKLETPCVHRRSCSQSPCAHRPSCLQQPCAHRPSSSLTLAIALELSARLQRAVHVARVEQQEQHTGLALPSCHRSQAARQGRRPISVHASAATIEYFDGAQTQRSC